jgi:hypothetical protein
VTAILHGDDGRAITESVDGAVSLSLPARCAHCRVLIHLLAGELTFEEDRDVSRDR